MKSKKNQRLLALILSMVLMLSASISAMAEGDVQTEASGTEVTQNLTEEQSLEEETVPETEVTTEEAGIDTQSAEISEEPVQETTEQEAAVTSGEATEPVQEATGESTETEVPTTEETTGEETQSVEGQPEETTTAEEQPAETSEETLPEEEVVSEAAELKQEFTDENGNVTQTITAYVPEGAFQATADQISMEVTLLNTDDTDYIKGMMEELIPENNYLDGYVLYQIDFKVNREIAKPAKAITITMTGNELAVEDTQKAHVFYYDSEDPEVEGDKDQLVEVIQKDQLIKSLEESGQSTENIEDYDYSEIAVNEGNADTITVKGWESTIYGCYVEKESVQEVTYEDDTVKVTVSADEIGIIPNKTTLQVVPISNNGDTKDQYKEVEKKLQEKAEKDEYEIAGFLAYDISFVDKDGNEVEPNGEVRVSLEYKKATLPEGMTEEEAKKAEVSMIHLEEDENGEVKEVVDMAEKDQVEAITTTESQQVEKVAVKTESFSAFTIAWEYKDYSKNDLKIVDDIVNTGELKTEISDELESEIASNSEIKYVWLKKEKGANEFSEVQLKKSGSLYNIVDGGKALNVIVDEADKENGTVYKVAICIGEYENDNVLVESSEFEIPYYKQLMNGGFETPLSHKATGMLKPGSSHGPISDDGSQWSNANYKYNGGVWQTTGVGTGGMTGHDIEVLNASNKTDTRNWFISEGEIEDAEDEENTNQFAEINCEAAGALYQDVLTNPNTTLNYWLSHRARSGESNHVKGEFDTMYLVIMPTSEAEKQSGSHIKLVNYLNDKLEEADKSREIPINDSQNRKNKEEAVVLYNQNGLLIARITSDKKDWHDISVNNITCDKGVESPVYQPTSSLTRFFFVSGATGNGTNTSGNLIDKIYFGQKMPEPDQGMLEISIRKTITGLNKQEVKNLVEKLTFEVIAKDTETKEEEENAPLNGLEVKASAMNWTYTPNKDGTVTARGTTVGSTIDLTGELGEWDKEYLYEVTEKNSKIDGMELESTSSIDVTGGEETENGAILGDQNAAIFDFTNEYTLSYRTEPVNFFLNLTSTIANTIGDISAVPNENFTTSVSGPLTAEDCERGIGIALNDDLKVRWPSEQEHSHEGANGGEIGVIGGTDSDNAKEVDSWIRELKDGTNGNIVGQVDKSYQIVNDKGEGAFPEDKDIFQYIRTYWNYTSENGNNVHKNGNIRVNGIVIDEEYLDTEHFAIRWYVAKDVVDDCWHIDGILVPKSGILEIKKTFMSEEIAEAVKNAGNFKIEVTGDFLENKSDGDHNTTIIKRLTDGDVEETKNEDGSVTYSWSLAIFGDEYTVTESGYDEGLGRWNYNNTECSYTDAQEGVHNLGNITSTTIQTDCNWSDESPKTQILDFTNYYTVKLDLKKVSANSETPVSGAMFKLLEKEGSSWKEIENEITIDNAATTPEIQQLKPGTLYKLEETLAPNGFALLGEPIYFKVSDGGVVLCDENGTVIPNVQNMWKLAENGAQLIIKNNPAYDLPSAGGPGIFLYMIGGTLLLMAGSLMIYINRRRGVLKK